MTSLPLSLILASSSPYRKELLARLEIPFQCHAPDLDERRAPHESIPDMVKRLSEAKAAKIAERYPEHLCIGSDAVASLGEELLGKPGTHENAVQQLTLMRGKTVVFYTGLCVKAPHYTPPVHLSITRVTFRSLSATEIEHYLQKTQPYQSAGSFHSETLGIALIESFEADDPTAIMGLPLMALCKFLRAAGLSPL